MAVYQVLSFPGPRLFCTIQKVGNFHATHAIMSIYNYLASSFFPDVVAGPRDSASSRLVNEPVYLRIESE